MTRNLLEVKGLGVRFPRLGHTALCDVSFHVDAEERVALVGESGAGKTLTALSLLGLLPGGAEVSGSVRFEGEELGETPAGERRRLNGRKIGMIFQDPKAALNPVRHIGQSLSEVLRLHGSCSKAEARERAVDWLNRVGLPDPKARYDQYPHELSGGMLQRVVIALALAGEPSLLIADEPTTALDATRRSEFLDLLGTLISKDSLGVLFISHDLASVLRFATRVLVLYKGQIVESSNTRALFDEPAHPYTRALLDALPETRARGTRLPVLGTSEARSAPTGCAFAAHCPSYFERCREAPSLKPAGQDRMVRCWLAPNGETPTGAT